MDPWDTVLILGAGKGGAPGRSKSSMNHLDDSGGFVFRHEREPVWVELHYSIGALAGVKMLEAKVRNFFGEESGFEMMTGFDDTGVARLQLGSEPLIVHLTFTRDDQGMLSAVFELFEELPD